jgi:hypothetical protein
MQTFIDGLSLPFPTRLAEDAPQYPFRHVVIIGSCDGDLSGPKGMDPLLVAATHSGDEEPVAAEPAPYVTIFHRRPITRRRIATRRER